MSNKSIRKRSKMRGVVFTKTKEEFMKGVRYYLERYDVSMSEFDTFVNNKNFIFKLMHNKPFDNYSNHWRIKVDENNKPILLFLDGLCKKHKEMAPHNMNMNIFIHWFEMFLFSTNSMWRNKIRYMKEEKLKEKM